MNVIHAHNDYIYVKFWQELYVMQWEPWAAKTKDQFVQTCTDTG